MPPSHKRPSAAMSRGKTYGVPSVEELQSCEEYFVNVRNLNNQTRHPKGITRREPCKLAIEASTMNLMLRSHESCRRREGDDTYDTCSASFNYKRFHWRTIKPLNSPQPSQTMLQRAQPKTMQRHRLEIFQHKNHDKGVTGICEALSCTRRQLIEEP